jgi:hypothetical protein
VNWYHILFIFSLAICIAGCLYHFIRLVRLGKPVDFSQPAGKTGLAVAYSFTGGMNPNKKESAFLHLPTYTAGIIYHIGTFVSIAWMFIFLSDITLSVNVKIGFAFLLIVSGCCGIGIFLKRMVKNELKSLSNPDDYISNILVTVFQLITAICLLHFSPVYFFMVSAMLLYLPVGKLKHVIYFFAARYHLGLFYGNRGVWPPKL